MTNYIKVTKKDRDDWIGCVINQLDSKGLDSLTAIIKDVESDTRKETAQEIISLLEKALRENSRNVMVDSMGDYIEDENYSKGDIAEKTSIKANNHWYEKLEFLKKRYGL